MDIQCAEPGVPPFKFLAYSKAGDVLLLRTNLREGGRRS